MLGIFEVENVFKEFYKMVEHQFLTKISSLHTNNGTKYFNEHLWNFLREKDIHHQSTYIDTPQQNGITKRKKKHLLEVARAIMFLMHVPKYLWGDVVLIASYLINRMPTHVLKYNTPLDCFNFFFRIKNIL